LHYGTAIGFVFAVVALSISVVSFPLLLDRDVEVRCGFDFRKSGVGEPFHHGAVGT